MMDNPDRIKEIHTLCKLFNEEEKLLVAVSPEEVSRRFERTLLFDTGFAVLTPVSRVARFELKEMIL